MRIRSFLLALLLGIIGTACRLFIHPPVGYTDTSGTKSGSQSATAPSKSSSGSTEKPVQDNADSGKKTTDNGPQIQPREPIENPEAIQSREPIAPRL
jgi:hypothetical protein